MGPIETCNSAPKVAVLHANTADKGWDTIETSISGANHAVLHAQNRQVMSGTNRNLLSGSKSCCFECKNNR